MEHWRQPKKLFIISLKSKFNESPAFYLVTLVLGQKREKMCDFKGQFRKLDAAQWQTEHRVRG